MATPHPTPSEARGGPVLTARTPEDLLAMVPVLLGFWPEESVVMLTFGARRPFHARIDLPPASVQDPTVLHELEQAILQPARDHGVGSVVFLYYSRERAAALGVHRVLRRGCRRSGIPLRGALHADGERYVELLSPDRRLREVGRRYDVSCHPFVVQGLVDGRIGHRTREEMVASLEPVPAAVQAVRAALDGSRHVVDGLPRDGRTVRDAGGWVAALVARHVRDGTAAGDADVARLVWSMQVKRVRDAAWSLIARREAPAHVAFWRDVVRRTPEELVAAPATLLGWAAWQAGDGAQAWAAVDRCQRAAPDYTMATYLGALLQHAVPPQEWSDGFDWTAGLPD